MGTTGFSTAFAAAAIGYGLGSIPFGLLLTRLAGTADIRSIGSGNIGATNVLRTGRKDLAAATLLLDALKGTVAVLTAQQFGDDRAAAVAAAGAFVGHVHPIWLGFRGGKGVATFLGCLLGVSWPTASVFGVVWLAVAAATRFSSAAALAASLVAPVLLLWEGRATVGATFFALAALLWWNHRANLARLLAGTESKIGRKA